MLILKYEEIIRVEIIIYGKHQANKKTFILRHYFKLE